MAGEGTRRGWEDQLKEAGGRLEEDIRRLVTYFNDEIVPDVRKNGSEALRSAAIELERLAKRMDDRRAATTASTPPPPPRPGDEPR